jgi:lysophospholipase L1-like esterase
MNQLAQTYSHQVTQRSLSRGVIILCWLVLSGLGHAETTNVAGALMRETQKLATEHSQRENIEWCDIWVPHVNERALPRVLLIGDSITRGYYPAVEKQLEGKATVARLATSAFITDPAILQEITLVLDNYQFDVIQFNNGMHGWQHSEVEYRDGFPKFLANIREHAHNAKLIWADTTPLKSESPGAESNEPASAAGKGVDAGKLMLKKDLTTASNTRISARNAIAHEFVQPLGIPVDDLYTPMLGHPEYYNGNVHFNAHGVEVQSRLVAAQIEAVLK